MSSSAASGPERDAKRTATRSPPPASLRAAVEDDGDGRIASLGEGLEPIDEAPLRARAVAPPPVGARAHDVVAVDDPFGHDASVARMSGLDRAVRTVVRDSLAVREGEDVLVVTDEPLQHLGERLREAAQAAGAEATLAVMSPRADHGNEPPRPIAAALAACDVFIAPTSRSLSHTQARKRASEHGARGATMPGVTEDILARLMDVDFARLACAQPRGGRTARAPPTRRTSPARRAPTCASICAAAPGSPTTATSRARARSATCPAARASSRRPGERGRSRRLAGGDRARARAARLTVDGGRLADATGPEGERLWAMLDAHGEAGRTSPSWASGPTTRRADRQRPRGREDARHRPRRVRGQRRGSAARSPCPSTSTSSSPTATLTVGDTTVLDAGRFVL